MSVTLKDGSRIEIRPIRPEDRGTLVEGFERLSPESRYRRFFAPVSRLRPSELDYLTQVDHHDHEALLAIDERTGDGVGVARFVRTSARVAEPALVVIDDWQGRGVGSALLEELVARARQEGVDRFQAPVLADNREAIGVLRKLGRASVDPQGREVLLSIDLPTQRPVRRRWPRLLAQFATGALLPGRSVLQLVWPHRAGEPEDERRNLIVVGVDGSRDSLDALEAAGSLAASSGAEVAVVGAHRFLAGHEAELEAEVSQAAARLRERRIEVSAMTRRGDPAFVLSDIAQEQKARLIVVGAGGRGPMARRLLGGVADLVAERAPCNVLIVRRAERPPGRD